MENKEFSTQIDSLESQTKELIHLVAGLLKTKALPHLSKPLLKTTKSYLPRANPLQLHLFWNFPRSTQILQSPQFSTLIIKITDNQRVTQRKRREKAMSSYPCQMISLICARVVRENLIIGTWPKPTTSILKEFNPQAHCYYHMDVTGHNITLKIAGS